MPQKYLNKLKQKRDGVINPKNYNLNRFWIRKILMPWNATNQPKSTVTLGYMCPRGLSGPPAVTLTKKLKYKLINLGIKTIMSIIK